jgi:tetratricopeptide (TPR) repeat protein
MAVQAAPVATLPPAAPQSSALVSVSHRVHQQVRYAFSLAGRGAVHTARVELTDALKLVAMALDADQRMTHHTAAMVAGLTALREADDFAVRDSQADVRIDVARLVATHKTPVLKDTVGPGTTPIEALQAYYTCGRQQLVIAGGQQVGASMALYGLGRVQLSTGDPQGMNGPKAITLQQAALAVDPQNYMAANELGVLLARYGQLSEAEAALRHSIAISPQPESWRNLAEVHRRQGQGQLEAQARRQGEDQLAARRSGKTPNPMASGIVDWVDPATFVALTDPSPGGTPVGELAAAAAVASPTPAPAKTAKPAASPWSLPEAIRGLTSRPTQNPKR